MVNKKKEGKDDYNKEIAASMNLIILTLVNLQAP